MEDKSSTQSGRQPWGGRLYLLAVAVVVLGAAAGAIYQLQKSPCTILVNGTPVANVESRLVAKKVLAQARELGSHGAPSHAVRFVDRVTLRGVSGQADMSELPEAVGALQKAAAVEAELYAINVDGTPLVALSSKADADQTLELVKQYYEKDLHDLVGKSTFKGDVFVEKHYIGTEKYYKNPEDACRALTSISEDAVTHTITPGDRAVHLAAQYHVSFNELKALNPGLDMDRLTEGDQLVIRPAKQPVVVICKAIAMKTVTVTPPSDTGRYSRSRTGTRVMRVMMTYENGRPAGEEIISQLTTWDRPKSSYADEGSSTGRHYRHYRRHRGNTNSGAAQDTGSTTSGASQQTPQ